MDIENIIKSFVSKYGLSVELDNLLGEFKGENIPAMSMVKTYIKKYGLSVNLDETLIKYTESYTPILKVKFRDDLRFSGQRVSYRDFTLFRICKKGSKLTYKPAFLSNESEGKHTVNVFPLINIGIAELMSGILSEVDWLYLNYSFTHLWYSSKLDANDDFDLYASCKVIKNLDSMGSVYDGFRAAHTLKRTRFSSVDFAVGKLANFLNYLYIVRPDIYVSYILNFMKLSYAFIGNSFGGTSIFESVTDKRVFSFSYKKVGYQVPGKKLRRYITDGTGAGVAAFLILFSSIYNTFAYYGNRDCEEIGFHDETLMKGLQTKFVNCLGDDNCGKYFKTGFFPEIFGEKVGSRDITWMSGSDYIETDIYNVNGSNIPRFTYESSYLYKKICQLSTKQVLLVDVAYTKFQEIAGSAVYLASIEPRNKIEDLEVAFKQKELGYQSEIMQLKDSLNSVRLDNKTMQSENKKLNTELKQAQIELENMSSLLSAKNTQLSKMNDKLDSCHLELQSYYNEDEVLEVKTNEQNRVSEDVMLDTVRDFKLCVVGGYSSIGDKLKELGLDVNWVQSENELSGTVGDSDFFCINTKFVGHKIVNLVKSRYKNQLDCFFYFNGTNVMGLLWSYYDFINKWMRGDDIDATS